MWRHVLAPKGVGLFLASGDCSHSCGTVVECFGNWRRKSLINGVTFSAVCLYQHQFWWGEIQPLSLDSPVLFSRRFQRCWAVLRRRVMSVNVECGGVCEIWREMSVGAWKWSISKWNWWIEPFVLYGQHVCTWHGNRRYCDQDFKAIRFHLWLLQTTKSIYVLIEIL